VAEEQQKEQEQEEGQLEVEERTTLDLPVRMLGVAEEEGLGRSQAQEDKRGHKD
jgi:hypothetical protein